MGCSTINCKIDSDDFECCRIECIDKRGMCKNIKKCPTCHSVGPLVSGSRDSIWQIIQVLLVLSVLHLFVQCIPLMK